MFEIEDSTEEELSPVTSLVLTTESSILEVSRNMVLNENVDDPMSGVGVVKAENSDIALRRRESYSVSEDSREYRPNERPTEADGPSPVESHPQNDDHSTGQTEYLKEEMVVEVKVEENVDGLSALDGRMTNRVSVNDPSVE
jgi:hypothetical protein